MRNPRPRKYTKEKLEKAVKESKSIREVLTSFGTNITGGSYVHISKLIKNYNIDISHFVGSGWAKGLTSENSLVINRIAKRNSYTIDKVLVENAPAGVSNAMVKKILVDNKLIPYCCKKCNNIGEWEGIKLVLQLDHINGVNNDNRVENLRFLCPNCHSQTPTFSNNKRV